MDQQRECIWWSLEGFHSKRFNLADDRPIVTVTAAGRQVYDFRSILGFHLVRKVRRGRYTS